MRIYRYGVRQRFGKHIDESVEDENGSLSQWTVLIYLNGEAAGSLAGEGGSGGEAGELLRGGETVFYKVRTRLSPGSATMYEDYGGPRDYTLTLEGVGLGFEPLIRRAFSSGLHFYDYILRWHQNTKSSRKRSA